VFEDADGNSPLRFEEEDSFGAELPREVATGKMKKIDVTAFDHAIAFISPLRLQPVVNFNN
jgi:hypothetical protein